MNTPEHEEKDSMTRREVYDAIAKLYAAMEAGFKDMRSEIRNVERTSQPNMANVWQGVGVGLVLVIALCGALFYYFNTRFALQDQARTESFGQINTRLELVENERSRKAERYDDLVNETLKKRLNNGASK